MWRNECGYFRHWLPSFRTDGCKWWLNRRNLDCMSFKMMNNLYILYRTWWMSMNSDRSSFQSLLHWVFRFFFSLYTIDIFVFFIQIESTPHSIEMLNWIIFGHIAVTLKKTEGLNSIIWLDENRINGSIFMLAMKRHWLNSL